jgi:checkpoint serine/threonine-protein kinase
MLDELERFTKKSRKSGSGSNTGVLNSDLFPLTLQGHRFMVSEKLGEGGFGSVFKAKDVGMKLGIEDSDDDDELDDEDEDDEDMSSMVALKVVRPRNTWEYHVLRRLHTALPPSLRRSIVLPHALYAFCDESYLVLDLCPQGMLLNIVNNAVSAGVAQAGACLDELLVIFFSIELLRLMEALHNAGFIHGDLKIDNCLLRLEEVPGGAAAWSGTYQPNGNGGWSYKGLKIIDFGRTIDTRLFPPNQKFIADWATDDRDCFEVRENRSWTYQTDYFGLAGIIYCMLFGKYIQASSVAECTSEDGVQKHKITTPFKRYWQTELWTRLFDVLLNPCTVRPDGELPVCDALSDLRKEMEQWLQTNCNRTSNTLKGLLKKVEMACWR